MSREAMKQALEALELHGKQYPHMVKGYCLDAITAIRKALAQPEQEPVHVPVTDNTYNYAKNLAEAIFKQHFASDEHYASGRIVWGVNDTVIGILTQIDNMIADMVRRPAQPEQEPVAWRFRSGTWFNREVQWRYIDTLDGAEGLRGLQPLYTAPRQWQGLTDEDMEALFLNEDGVRFARYIEAKLKEKNHG